MAMKLYDAGISPFCARNRVQISAKGLEHKIEIVPRPPIDQFRTIVVTGKVPALDTRTGLILVESDTIAHYIEDRFPATSLRGKSPESDARIRLICRILDLYFFTGIGILTFQRRSGVIQDDRVAEGLALIDNGMGWIEAHLDGAGYAVDGRLTLADCALATGLFFTFTTEFFGVSAFAGHDRLRGYYEAVLQSDPHCARGNAQIATAMAERMQNQQTP